MQVLLNISGVWACAAEGTVSPACQPAHLTGRKLSNSDSLVLKELSHQMD